jgi:hypothetical protein
LKNKLLKLTEKEINEKIVEKFDFIKKSKNAKLKQIHYKSIKNFIGFLLIDNDKSNTKSNIEKLGKVRKKELLLEYLIEIENEENITEEESNKLFRKYVYPIGLFMSSYFGFSFIDIGTILMKILIFVVPAIIIDFLILEFTDRFYFLSILVILFFSIRYILKYTKGKVFGFKY